MPVIPPVVVTLPIVRVPAADTGPAITAPVEPTLKLAAAVIVLPTIPPAAVKDPAVAAPVVEKLPELSNVLTSTVLAVKPADTRAELEDMVPVTETEATVSPPELVMEPEMSMPVTTAELAVSALVSETLAPETACSEALPETVIGPDVLTAALFISVVTESEFAVTAPEALTCPLLTRPAAETEAAVSGPDRVAPAADNAPLAVTVPVLITPAVLICAAVSAPDELIDDEVSPLVILAEPTVNPPGDWMLEVAVKLPDTESAAPAIRFVTETDDAVNAPVDSAPDCSKLVMAALEAVRLPTAAPIAAVTEPAVLMPPAVTEPAVVNEPD